MLEKPYLIVRTDEEFALARRLIEEYAESLGCSPCLRNIELDMRSFPHPFAAPGGALLLTRPDGAGVVGIKKVDEGLAEMARLYVRPSFRGRKLGRILALGAIDQARQLDYKALRLYTLPEMKVALDLYRKLNFREIAPYGEHIIPGASYLEKNLADQ